MYVSVPSFIAVNKPQTRSPDFIPFHLHLRTWLPDRIYSILQQRPLPIPSSLPGLSESNPRKVSTYLPPNLPESPEEQEDFLEEESIYHPNILLYRFYACGGFWICSSEDIELFLLSISPKALCQSVPFIRQVLNAKIRHQVPRLEDQDHNFQNLTKTVDGPSNLGPVYALLFRALATQGRVQESISLWEECESRNAPSKNSWLTSSTFTTRMAVPQIIVQLLRELH
jgi:hypothetical protein